VRLGEKPFIFHLSNTGETGVSRWGVEVRLIVVLRWSARPLEKLSPV